MLDSQSEEQLRMITSGQQHWQTTCCRKKKMMIDLDIINDSVPVDHWKRTFFRAMPF